jgi:hypothetical protein
MTTGEQHPATDPDRRDPDRGGGGVTKAQPNREADPADVETSMPGVDPDWPQTPRSQD